MAVTYHQRRPRDYSRGGSTTMPVLIVAAMAAAATAFLHPIPIRTRASPVAAAKSNVRCRPFFAVAGPPGPEFARDAASIVLPSVASITPVGVRNVTSRGAGFVVEFPSDRRDEDEDEGDCGARNTSVHLITAAHVASPGTRVSVSFSPELNLPEDLPATVLGRDTAFDLALIRVDCISRGDDVGAGDGRDAPAVMPPPLQFYQFDGEDQTASPPIGTLAFACGYPSGIDGVAFTMGIVCGTARGPESIAPWIGESGGQNRQSNDTNKEANSNSDDGGRQPVMFQNVTFIVTDASMAPGMSGGPLTSANGEVVGMCALVRPGLRSLGNYAVSASTCQEFLHKIMTSRARAKESNSEGEVAHPVLGYRVVLFNDRMNKKERIAQVLRDAAKVDNETAESIMMSAHSTGRGVVRVFGMDLPGDGDFDIGRARSMANDLCESMRMEDVLVEVEEISR